MDGKRRDVVRLWRPWARAHSCQDRRMMEEGRKKSRENSKVMTVVPK